MTGSQLEAGSRKLEAEMNGVLVVDKPVGPTSHDVVARVRRALRTPRVGHTGTLDPLATGVLPLVIGSATRLASLLSGTDKEYVAGIRLGVATDTYDSVGYDGTPCRIRQQASMRPLSKLHSIGSMARFNSCLPRFPRKRSVGFRHTSSRAGAPRCSRHRRASPSTTW